MFPSGDRCVRLFQSVFVSRVCGDTSVTCGMFLLGNNAAKRFAAVKSVLNSAVTTGREAWLMIHAAGFLTLCQSMPVWR